MLTDWLIFLDLLEDNYHNTKFLRLITPIIFGIIETHHHNYKSGYGDVSGSGDGWGSGSGYGAGFGDGYGFGNGDGYGYFYILSYDEEH